ncbi:MAG TPA: hypothetical protein VFZ78_01675, partial [Flavisolibacter sp.]
YPIPRDRDNALFYSNGVIPAFAKLTFMKHLSGFKKSSSGLKRLNGKAWLFDKTFLNELDRATWKKIIADFQHGLPDAVIEKAVRLLPPEVFARDGALIIDKLKKRRDGLMEHALDYYEFISEQVTVKGSNEEEIFVATTDPANNLVITMYRGKNGKRQKKLYERRFAAGETHILHLEGFDGNDHFITDQQAASRTRIRFFGGNGADTYSLKGDIRSEVIDTTSEKNIVLDSRSAKIRFQ